MSTTRFHRNPSPLALAVATALAIGFVAPAANTQSFPATFNLASLDVNSGFRLDGEMEGDLFGFSVSTAGDVNGDGIDDLVIGSPSATNPNGNNAGNSYVVFGNAAGFPSPLHLSSLDGSNGFRLDGAAANDFSGTSVSVAGDINGDGFDDLLVAAPYASLTGTYSGSTYVVFGAAAFEAIVDLNSLDTSDGFRLDGETAYDQFGFSVSAAGNMNGDSFDDLIISAPYASLSATASGSSYVVFGSNLGFDPVTSLTSLDGSNGFRLDGAAAYDYSGRSVSAAGDINGDGLDDLVIGANRASPISRPYAGSSYVVYGDSAGFAPVLNLSNLDGGNGFRLDGVAANDFSGASVSGAGDINDDGLDDLIIGALGAGLNGNNASGSSYVVYGDNAGFAPVLDLSSLNGSNGFRLDGVAANDFSGTSVSGAGDINGDDIDDLIIAAPYASPNDQFSSGSSYVVYGDSAGFGFASELELSNLDGVNGFRLDGVAAYDESGHSISAAGDVNGDGVDDLIIGAQFADLNGDSSGSSYIVFGRVPEVIPTLLFANGFE